MRNPAAVEPLIDCVEESDGLPAAEAVAALGKIKDRRAIGPLIKLLVHPEPRVRDRAYTALMAITGKTFKDHQQWETWWKKERKVVVGKEARHASR
jgi:HEAT repeat protein